MSVLNFFCAVLLLVYLAVGGLVCGWATMWCLLAFLDGPKPANKILIAEMKHWIYLAWGWPLVFLTILGSAAVEWWRD